MPSQPSEGTARPMLVMATVRRAPRPVCPMYSPIGRAIAIPAASDAAESERCSQRRIGIPLLPVQLWGSVYHAGTWPRISIGLALPRLRPRGQLTLHRQQSQVDDRGQQDDDHDSGDGRGREAALDADVHDQVAE